MENLNTTSYLDDIRLQLFDILSSIEAVPGTQIHTGQDGTTQIPSASISDLDIPPPENEGLDTVSYPNIFIIFFRPLTLSQIFFSSSPPSSPFRIWTQMRWKS